MTDTTRTTTGAEIVLEDVTKSYPNQKAAAVDHVSLTIPAGEVVVLVGPSGCGKTTTMRMINRLIEPTSGRITIGGKDALSIDPNELRRTIGYSIQQAGLFPHMTIAQNVGMVPGLIGWNKKKISDRTDEMLDLVGLDPGQYRERYPRQLSGGQQQRVGVARALAADPPVLLMDEPFGAVDPITRGLLQDELMRLQAELGKTIVFVTHDFDEAVKLGDRIAVLGNQSRILQYDTPEAVLANPADETVAGFVGAGAALKQLTLMRVRDIELSDVPAFGEDEPVETMNRALGNDPEAWGLILDARKRPIRWTDRRHLAGVGSLRDVGVPIGELVSIQSTLQDALEALLAEGNATATVTGKRGEYVGTVTIEALIDTIKTIRSQHAHDHDDVVDTGAASVSGASS
ncbi:ATP-binding cassette domain-containing protein [Rhodococcus sp. BP-349]|uniref:ABC transporter ATP-binding protein n=1 Tax=unclassified Rhodococcus (in: high G+C Gram-positive bacteria) TaxID=192944 RepID=UPI001C9AAB28|nr:MULTISPECIES: ATP-binding cassette domain-containing protein [unclassified Rhodococcus (in: high G+C Gram-positive bacteria)]MBY6540677.1 ATP-binding cassette domain-containing protein [Rhodococcus sp. BP-363]MBY6545298.1 ATP-binding cassette domain-containing protein [Rhodococcus sp. BP-369]MBY6564528.1 ATP-binding cassette domain-containing protein [Rhodococcus sp. BP-370]MBY6578536.1 ATP-binding cassette domain-containing protein [Rhodococcus sp. BP-364]MBY6587837.1 ATP-binding cassette 